MAIATKKFIAIYSNTEGHIAIHITIYWDSVKSKNSHRVTSFIQYQRSIKHIYDMKHLNNCLL